LFESALHAACQLYDIVITGFSPLMIETPVNMNATCIHIEHMRRCWRGRFFAAALQRHLKIRVDNQLKCGPGRREIKSEPEA
jgi:hypothetical protein